MRVHIIRDGVVANTIEAASVEAAAALYPGATAIEATSGGAGWTWDGSALSPPVTPATPVPAKVTNFQARAALMQADLFGTVDAAVMGGTDALAKQAWEYANEITRDGALVNSLAAGLGLTDAQLDDLFRTAATIEA